MPDTTELSEMGRTLGDGFQADRVVMTGGRLRRLGFQVDDETREHAKAVFKGAKELVETLLAGEDVPGTEEVSQNAGDLAEGYLTAVRAVHRANLTDRPVRDLLSELREGCEELSVTGQTSPERLGLVLKFFATLSSLAFEQASADLLPGSGPGLPELA